ncbi:hypothetical protein L483_14630 [Pseudomonas putida H8234]|nr:hypothetical protein L483_14630 [Pseudomonas putida H8234]
MGLCKLDEHWVLLCGNRGRASGSRHDFKAVQAEGVVSLVYFVYTLLGDRFVCCLVLK